MDRPDGGHLGRKLRINASIIRSLHDGTRVADNLRLILHHYAWLTKQDKTTYYSVLEQRKSNVRAINVRC